MKRKHVDKYWQCVKLAAKEEFSSLSDADLRTEHCDYAYCELCKITIYCAKGNNEVGSHMRVYHADLLQKYDEAQRQEEERHQLAVGFDQRKKAKKSTHRITAEDQEYANYLVAKWIAESMRPLTIVEDEGFIEYVKYITEVLGGIELGIPSRAAVREIIRSLANEKRAALAKRLAEDCKFYSLTTDLWTDRSLRSFMSTTIHYAGVNFNTFGWVLGVTSFPGKHDAFRIRAELDDLLKSWDLHKSHCTMLLRDGASNAVKAARLLEVPHMSCISHSLHLVVGAALLRKPRRAPARRAASMAAGTETTATDAAGYPGGYVSVGGDGATASPIVDSIMTEFYEEEDAEVSGEEAARIVECREKVIAEMRVLVDGAIPDKTDQQHLEDMRDIVGKFRKIATYFHRSSKGTYRLSRLQNDGEVKHVILDCPTR